jgi:oligopeptidase B
VLAEAIPNTYYALEWANDNRTIFYSTLDDASRPFRLHRHTLGSDPASDELLYEETDESFFLWLSKSNSAAYLFLTLRSTTTTEVHYLAAEDANGSFRVFQPRQHKVEYYLYHHGERFLVLTNQDAPNFKVFTAPVSNPASDHWQELVPHRPTVYLYNLEVFADYLVRFERESGLQQIRYTNPEGGNLREVHFPEAVYAYTVDPDTHQEFTGHTIRFTYSSLVTPKSVIDYSLRDETWEVKKQQEIPSGYDASQYESQRLWATARDGAQVPLTVVYKKGLQRNGRNPTLLYGYGSYGACVDPEFNPRYLSLLDRGFVYAIAHIRGGAELGRDWYEQGRMLNKLNTFTDFIDCGEYLIAQGFTSRDKLAIYGVSAGGLLMGAVTHLRPDLFQAVVAKVPFVDVINTISDPSIPLTVIEWEQWGNPAHKDEFDYMLAYSPYDQLEAKDYPNLLVTAGLNDPRVAYWEPAKWTAKLRATKTDGNWLLLKTNMAAGHAGSSGRYDALHEMAFIYAFVIDRLGA